MEDLEKEPEEIPMEEVLAEIRQMLSAEVENTTNLAPSKPLADKSTASEPPTKEEDTISANMTISATRRTRADSDCFLLTPAMRCDLPSDDKLSAQAKAQAQRVLSRLQQTANEPKLAPEIEAWLNKNLPAIVEKIVAQKLANRQEN